MYVGDHELPGLGQDATMDPASGMFFGTSETDVTAPATAAVTPIMTASPGPVTSVPTSGLDVVAQFQQAQAAGQPAPTPIVPAKSTMWLWVAGLVALGLLVYAIASSKQAR
jgi:hypothetical protein